MVMQKYAKALENLIKADCEIVIYKTADNLFNVEAVDNVNRIAYGTDKQYRKALVLCWEEYHEITT